MATIAVFLLVLILLTPPLGAYMYRIYSRERVGRLEGLCYRVLGVNPRRGAVVGPVRRFAAVVQRDQHGLRVRDPAAAGAPARSTPSSPGRQPVRRVQHGRQLHDQHELAGLRRRDDDELPHADGWRSRSRTSSSAAVGIAVLVALIRGFTRTRTANVGNFWRDLVRGIALPPAAALDPVRDRADEPGRGADPRRLRRGHAAEGVRQLIARGPVASPAGDQAARHERRRLLQRQLGASVREPDAAVEHPGAVRDPVDSLGADLHVRQVGRQRPRRGG